MNKLVTLLALFTTSLLSAQTGTVIGTITDSETGNPIASANVYIDTGTDQLTQFTDEAGEFTLTDVPVGKWMLTISMTGYEDHKETVLVRSNETTTANVGIKPTAELMEITVIEEIVDYPMVEYDVIEVELAQEYYYIDAAASMRTVDEVYDYSAADVVSSTTNSSYESVTLYDGHASYNDGDSYNTYQQTFAAGQLTATEINDFAKWELWNDITEDQLATQVNHWDLAMDSRYTVQVTSELGLPVVNATVHLLSDTKIIWQAVTDNTGKAELWNSISASEEDRKDLDIVVYAEGYHTTIKTVKSSEKGPNKVEMPVTCGYTELVDIAFAVDATGSMDDEIDYLKVELEDIINKVQDQYANMNINTGTVFYKCTGNDYSTKFSQFTDNLSETIDYIRQQDADDGGEELVDSALYVATHSLEWREDARARLLFLVLDEPSANDALTKRNLQEQIALCAEMGIKIIPIVASGEGYDKDRNLEYLMRCAALGTNGTCAFITDHSGIGNSHTEPVTDEMTIETLNELILRVIDQNLYVPPCEEEVFIVEHETEDTTMVEVPVDLAANSTDDTDTNFDTRTDTATIADPEVATTFSFYPNPTNGPITINVDGDVQDLYLADMSGKLMQRIEVNGETSVNVDLSEYPTGIYFIQCIQNDQPYSGKVVLTRY